MRHTFLIVSMLVLPAWGHALPILHTMTCAGLLDPSHQGIMDTLNYDYEKHEGLYRIDGRLRRVTIVTSARYAHEGSPDRSLEVPLVDARRPGRLARLRPALRYLFDSEPVRALKILFNDPVHPRVTESLRNGVPRFTYHLAFGANATAEHLRELAIQLYVRGYGRRATFPPNAKTFEVVIGRRVLSGTAFYELVHAVNLGASPASAPVPRGWARLKQYATRLNVAQLWRNARLPAVDKVGYRPRFEYDGDAHGDLTAARLTEIAIDLEERTELPPERYDVLVAGRALTGTELIELHHRLLAREIVSIDAERGLAEAGRVGRASVLMDNVTWALSRHDVNEIVVITRYAGEVASLADEFDARFGRAKYQDGEAWPLLDATSADRADARTAELIALVARTFERKHFATAAEFVAYYDPRRIEGLSGGDAAGTRIEDLSDVALVAHYYFRTLRRNLPEFYRLAPTSDVSARLRALPAAFGPYEFTPFERPDEEMPFSFATVRRSSGPVGADLRPNEAPLD